MGERFGAAVNDPRFHYVSYDAAGPLSLDFEADYVVHAATSAHPLAYATDPVGILKANVIGTMNLLEHLLACGGRRLLFVSTGEIYGENPDVTDGFSEDGFGKIDSMNPRSCYPESKRAAETLCASYVRQFGADAVVARLCYIYGPTIAPDNSRADAQFLRKALAGEDIVMQSRGTQMRSYCYIADCAAALLTVLLCGESCEAYNLANPDARVTIAGFAEAVAKVTGRRVVFADEQDVPKNQQTPITYAVLDSDKLCALGWKGQYSVEDGVANTVNVLTGK
jgi:nucleoside-diphosphate-sugar epimerase